MYDYNQVDYDQGCLESYLQAMVDILGKTWTNEERQMILDYAQKHNKTEEQADMLLYAWGVLIIA